jgi:hypothetical protein
MISELIKNLIHLKSSKDGLNEDRGLDGAPSDTDPILSKIEHIIPQASLTKVK